MSDLNDLIATNAVRAYNQGVERGTAEERDRIIKLLEGEKFILPEGIDEGLTLMPIQEAIALIKGEQQ